MLSTVKAWILPLARTFIAAFLTAVVAGLTSVTSVPALWTLIAAAAVTAANVVVLALQKATPGVADPVPPVA